MTGKLDTCMERYCYTKKKKKKINQAHIQCQRQQCLMDIQSNLIVYDKLLCKNESINTVRWSAVGGKWETVRFHSLPFPSSHSRSHSHSHKTSLAISIPMGIPWDRWEFPIQTYFSVEPLSIWCCTIEHKDLVTCFIQPHSRRLFLQLYEFERQNYFTLGDNRRNHASDDKIT